jgi:acetyltransferase-like isoleucine patch superfamily enzyme
VRIVSKLKKSVLSRFKQNRFPKSYVHENVFIDSLSSLGLNCVIFSHVKVLDSSIGCFTYVQEGSSLFRTEVGKYTSIAGNVAIGYPDHPMKYVSTSPVFYDKTQPLPFFFDSATKPEDNERRTIIEHDVWIGQNTFVKAGVRIGTGTVIGAGSVVTKDIPPYSIAVGNPCKVIRSRFSEDITSQLLDSKWWDLDTTILNRISNLFFKPTDFLKEFNKL